jgi:D-alanyl-D-alanine dipeptidase
VGKQGRLRKAKVLTFVFGMAVLLIFDLCPGCRVKGSAESANVNPFLEQFMARNVTQISKSKQLIFATNGDASSALVTIRAVEKNSGAWRLVFPPFVGSIGKRGFAAIGKKTEGDGKSPSGIFPLGTVFGYYPSVKTRMPYRQATENDFWVDDPNSEDYNKWIRGKPKARSWERMRRDDGLYQYGVVIEYNMHPVVRGNGSAIFLHIWKDGESTSGCVAMPEGMVLKILAWLDPVKKPLIIMGSEAELLSEKFGSMIDIKEMSPRILVDLQYATENNVARKRLYDLNRCFLRRSTAIKLDTVQRDLEGMGLGLKVWDCYRPLSVQRALWKIMPDERYVADPRKGSRHNRGSAVDVTLVDSGGNELQMPTAFDDFSPRAHHDYRNLPEGTIRNRALLKGVMEKAGFIPLAEEWWHYDDENWAQFELMDVPFREFPKHRN